MLRNHNVFSTFLCSGVFGLKNLYVRISFLLTCFITLIVNHTIVVAVPSHARKNVIMTLGKFIDMFDSTHIRSRGRHTNGTLYMPLITGTSLLLLPNPVINCCYELCNMYYFCNVYLV